jgi:hypothetical protein
MAYQYANHEDQDLVDDLITATTFDESLANEILFRNLVIMGYEEYRDVFRAAWQVNRSRAEGAEPFRIIGIGQRLDYTLIQNQEDVDDPEVIAKVFQSGIPDETMANVILEQIIEPGDKGLAFMKLEHAFTSYRQPQYAQRMREQGFSEQRRAGAILSDRLGSRVMTTIFHMPLQDTRSRVGYGYPIGGVMEKAFDALPEGTQSVGFDVAPSPYAEAPLTSDVMNEGFDEDVTLGQFTDGYLMIGKIADYTAVTPIPNFITEENIAEARAQFPGPDPGEVSVADMNDYIAGTASSLNRIFEEFE